METRFLETFLIVAEHGSLAEASRRLGITPAAVAQRMQALEDEIGVSLLMRAGRRVKPTEAGHAILDHSRRILSEVRHLRGLAHHDLPSGELRLGAISTALTGLLPPALRHVFDTMPDVEVFLLPGTSADLYQGLMDEKIDAAILVRPPFPIVKTFNWKLLRSERLVLMTPEKAAMDAPHYLLREMPFIRYDRNNWGGRLAEQYLRNSGIRPREWLELDSLEAIAVMVGNGLGVSLVPDWSTPWQQTMNVVRLELPMKAVSREVGMLWPRNSPAGRLIALVFEALENQA
ncbi:LysR family transcriptional regulator [Phyllobacterium phragmitis]|uniref:LysR family transcriptional regulator n=1 Tax=Phyllobacterium phragmitis TaxID=2670329 RepID=A0A2S9IWC8_9HYPH|nr:LysR family transcriptional regulator [Phyllobacterium phragmitis]PRD44829.1 LysR family transcriptional regulator [Phyllobacterium phragmitis]